MGIRPDNADKMQALRQRQGLLDAFLDAVTRLDGPRAPPRPSPGNRYAARVFIAAEETGPPRSKPMASRKRSGRRLRPDLVDGKQALELAKAFARAAREGASDCMKFTKRARRYLRVAITTSSPEESRGGSCRPSFQNAGSRSRRFSPWRRTGFLAGWPGRAGTRRSSCDRHHRFSSYLSPQSSLIVYLPLELEGHCPLDAGGHSGIIDCVDDIGASTSRQLQALKQHHTGETTLL